jgi:membrane-bound lytic murein transglycosylase D
LRNQQITKCIFVLLLVGIMGCATGRSDGPTLEGRTPFVTPPSASRQEDPAPPPGPASAPRSATEPIESAPGAIVAQNLIPAPEIPPSESQEAEDGAEDAAEEAAQPEQTEKSDQEGLDSALELCQISNEYWEKGDMENALGALDEAYGLILKVSPNQDPNLLQQKEDLRFTISKRIIECYSARFKVANGFHSEIPVVMNRHVEEALEMFKGPLKDFFTEAYARSGRYRPAIVKALKEAGLPEELSWLPFIESGFKVRALSRARALGMWQFIASTGYKYGLKRDKWIDERMDTEKSTRAAIAYLKELHQIFGDWTTALAAYNCGEGTVLRCIQTQRVNYLDNFWDLYQKLPRETAFYVPQFQAVLHIINNPERHGFILPPVEEPLAYEEVMVDKQVHMEDVAKILGVPNTILKDLNPELRHHATPDRRYALKVPAGNGPALLAQLKDLPAWSSPVPVYEIHRVRRGDTLPMLARKYGTSVNEIKAANGFRRGNRLKVGAKIKIPTLETAGYRNQKPRPAAPAIPAKPQGQYATYVVKSGDNLWKIASQFNTTTNVLQSINILENSELQIGQTLKVPAASPAPRSVQVINPTAQYTVQEGDSPFVIAQKHQMDLSDLLDINRLTPRSVIFPGQVLLLKAE